VVVDEWGWDLCYSGTQKCLSCPPGLAPVTLSERCMDRVRARASRVQSWYLDLRLIEQYWGEERVYHHTAPVSMNYALREALRLIREEGLRARWARHRAVHGALVRGLTAMGLEMVVSPPYRLPTLNTVRIPAGVDDGAVRRELLERFNLEIGGGLGPLKGRAWRVGLMGHSARLENVVYFLTALEAALATQGLRFRRGAGPEAALAAE
jgi:alanine-glyoxylate transaminase/serine-glyoxylate transaminase/serine-pyruvate transaminase